MLRVLNRLQALKLSVWLFLRPMTAIKCLSETVLRRRKLEGLSFFCVTGLQRASKVLISFPSFLSSAPRRERLMMPDVQIKLAKGRFHSSISADRYWNNNKRECTTAPRRIFQLPQIHDFRLLLHSHNGWWASDSITIIFQIATLATVPVRYQ